MSCAWNVRPCGLIQVSSSTHRTCAAQDQSTSTKNILKSDEQESNGHDEVSSMYMERYGEGQVGGAWKGVEEVRRKKTEKSGRASTYKGSNLGYGGTAIVTRASSCNYKILLRTICCCDCYRSTARCVISRPSIMPRSPQFFSVAATSCLSEYRGDKS